MAEKELTRSGIWRKHLHPGMLTEWDAVDAILKDLEASEAGTRYWRDRAGPAEFKLNEVRRTIESKLEDEKWVCLDCSDKNHGLLPCAQAQLTYTTCEECHGNKKPCIKIWIPGGKK